MYKGKNRNYVYEEPDLLSSPNYKLLYEKVKLLNKNTIIMKK